MKTVDDLHNLFQKWIDPEYPWSQKVLEGEALLTLEEAVDLLESDGIGDAWDRLSYTEQTYFHLDESLLAFAVAPFLKRQCDHCLCAEGYMDLTAQQLRDTELVQEHRIIPVEVSVRGRWITPLFCPDCLNVLERFVLLK